MSSLRPRSPQLVALALTLAAMLNVGVSAGSATPYEPVSPPAAHGRIGGAGIDSDRVAAYGTRTYSIWFRGGEVAEVAVRGDGDTDLDLYVYDDLGNLITSDLDITDNCFVSWVPLWTRSYRVEIHNLGSVYNEYVLTTN